MPDRLRFIVLLECPGPCLARNDHRHGRTPGRLVRKAMLPPSQDKRRESFTHKLHLPLPAAVRCNIVLFSSTFGKAKGRAKVKPTATGHGKRKEAAPLRGRQARGHESSGGARKGTRALPSLSVYSDADADAVQVLPLIKGRVNACQAEGGC